MLDELGRGGFATVYKVRHNELGYIRAIRVLNETIVDASSPTYQKFLRECKVLLRLGNGNHPNIVHIYQPRLLDNKALVEMDYVDGQDITHYLQQKRNFVPVDEVVRMATQMSSALAYCHEDIYRFCMDRETDSLQDDPNDGSKVLLDEKIRQRLITKYKVIHNDIHSGNIMRREDGNFVLLDFGLAIEGKEVVRSSRRKNGAPEFKAPEKWEDESILTEQSDIYSFGIVLYQYLAGRVPFPYNTNTSSYKAEFELGEAHQQSSPPSIEDIRKAFFESKFAGQTYQKDYPQWLEDVILKCLRKNPAERFRNGKELFDCIQRYMQEETTVSTQVMNKLVELTTLNKTMEEELKSVKGINTSLNQEINRIQNRFNQTEQLLHKSNEQLETSEREIKSLQTEIVRLKQEGSSGTGKWKVLTAVLLLALIACGGLLGYFYSEQIQETDYWTTKYYAINEQQLCDTTSTHQQIVEDNNNEQIDRLNRQIRNLQDENAQLRTSSQGGSEYQGHDARYWYNQYSQKSGSDTYQGHDAQYWYNENESTKRQKDKYKKLLNDNI